MNTTPPAGDEQFRSLFAHTYDDVLRFAQRRLPRAQAEDAVAEAFLVAWRRFAEAPQSLDDRRAWLFGITRKCMLNARRSQGRTQALNIRLVETTPTQSPEPIESDALAARLDMARAWRHLTARDQEVIALDVFESLTSAQAGHVLGISAAAYRLRLMRARTALRSELDRPAPHATSSPATQETRS
jgi:RNA polymerase sigma-70 factor (ECF subfamily)